MALSVRDAPHAQPGFRREVGFWALMFVSLGSIIGSGWLLGALTAVTSAGGASILSWMLTGAIIALLALVHSELGAAYPFTGGTACWPRLAFGSLGGFTAGWVSWLQAVTIAPIEVEAALNYLAHKWPGRLNAASALTPTGLVAAVALMLLFTLINILGVRWLAESNRIIMFWKIAVPVLTIVILWVVSFRFSNFIAGGGFAPYGAHGVFAALPLGVFFAMQGFEQAAQIGGEARDPQRDVPRAVLGAVVVSTVLYVALDVAFIGALNPAHLVQGWANPLGDVQFGPYATLATSLGLTVLAGILYLDAFISPADAGLIYMGVSARLAYALGHAGYVPRGVSRISSRGVPWVSILLAFGVGLICILPFPTWQSLVGLVTSATAIMYSFAPITLLALRKSDPDRPRPYRLPAAPVLAPLAFISANELIYWTSWTTLETLMPVVVAGYLVFGIFYALGRPTERPPLDLRSLLWVLPWLTGLTVISYLGQYGGTKLIPEWIDFGVVAAFSLVICSVAVRLSLPRDRVAAAVEAEIPAPVDLLRLRAAAPPAVSTFPGAVVRQLRYNEGGLAVLDASADVVAANWTAKVGPTAFVSETVRMIGLDGTMQVAFSSSLEPGITHTTMSVMREALDSKTFDATCEFVRLDLSATQSAFWERPPDEGLIIVGFADRTSAFTEDTTKLVGRLLEATATPAVDIHEVLSSLRSLAQQYADPEREHPHGTGAPE